MSDENLNATQVVEGTGTETPAQVTDPNAQAPDQPQETTTAPVENGSNKPQVPETTRRKPSDYYHERQTIRELKETVALLRKKQDELESVTKQSNQSVAPEVPDFDPAHFSPEHKRILAAREKALRDAYDAKIAAIEQRFSAFEETKAVAESQRKYQEALEKLFPKSSPDSKETLEERYAKNPERTARIKELLAETGLNELSTKDPDRAVRYLLLELGETPTEKTQNPTVLKKTMMGGAPTGNPGMGAKRTPSEQDLLAEKNKLNAQLDADPSLRHDPKFMERRVQVLSEIERLVTKK